MCNSLFTKRNMKETGSVDYMIDISYGEKDWDMAAGIREVLANMLDTKTEYSHKYVRSHGYCEVNDKGTGLPKKALVMGASSKSKDNTSIGQFGEGLKLCFVTALRNGKRISISTVGFGVEITSVHSEEYDCELMRVVYTDNCRKEGTSVRIECDEEDYLKAVDMFLEFKEDYHQLDKNLYLPGGFLSIMGLATEQRPDLLFSYNLDDKSMTNRDRNVVKSRTLKAEMQKILERVKSKEAIDLFLNGLSDDSKRECYEYKTAFTPKLKKVWQAEIEEKYGKDAVYSSTPEGDIKAIAKGIKVIPAPTKAVKDLFKALGLKSSAMKTRGIKNEKIVLKDEKENKLTYPISKDYVKSWKIADAGREILANALDTSSDASVEWKDGICVITDTGKGISRKHFVIGNSEKGADAIGLFGEGFKMAALVMAREKREMHISTVGFDYRPALEKSKEFGTETFCFYYEKNKKKSGTEISFKASEEEVEKIKGMFICFHTEKKPIATIGPVDVYDDRDGYIYVNGLQTTKMESLFSYNIKDKTLVDSRDRNHVDEVKLNTVIKQTIDAAGDPEMIKKLLTGWQTEERGQFLKEYSFVLEPQMSFMWFSAAQEVFKNCCIASSFNHEANFKASQAGYQVLANVPPYILSCVLSNVLQNADKIAEEIGDNGICFGNRIVFPVTSNYVKTWKDEDAIREFASNAIDAASGPEKIHFEYKDGMCLIEDDGKGFDRRNLLIGESTSREIGNAIGTFGEGMKLACLTITRRNARKVTIETVGFTVKAEMKHDEKFHADVLVFTLSENDRKKGTSVSFPTDELSFDRAKDCFLAFDESKKEIDPIGIYEGGMTGIYVNGVRICQTGENGMYSYNIESYNAKSMLSRDRKAFLSDSTEHGMIAGMLFGTKENKVIENILKSVKEGSYESIVLTASIYSMNRQTAKKWKRIAQKLWPKSCIPSRNAEMDLVAKDNHLTVLTDLNATQLMLLRAIGFPEAREAMQEIREQENRGNSVPLKELTTAERAKFDLMSRVISEEYGKSMPSKIKISEDLGSGGGSVTLGCYQTATDTVMILRSLLSGPDAVLLGTAAHEFEHRFTGADDRTREFESGLTKKIGTLLCRLYAN